MREKYHEKCGVHKVGGWWWWWWGQLEKLEKNDAGDAHPWTVKYYPHCVSGSSLWDHTHFTLGATHSGLLLFLQHDGVTLLLNFLAPWLLRRIHTHHLLPSAAVPASRVPRFNPVSDHMISTSIVVQ